MQDNEQQISFSSLFSPLTTVKAIHWIVIIGLVVYANMLFNGFVWDDIGYIIANKTIRDFNLITLFGANEFNSAGYYRPIPAVYFSLLYNLFHSNSFFYHSIQLILHIINACLVFSLFKKIISLSVSFLLAILFLIHPIQVESVVYIGATQSELLVLFGMVGVLLSMSSKNSWKRLFVVSIMVLLSIFTKETGFLFLFATFGMQYIYNKKIAYKLIPYLLGVFGIYCFVRFVLVGIYFEHNTSSPIGILSLSERLHHIPVLFFYYIKTIFYPMQLGIDQRWTIASFTIWNGYAPLFLSLVFLCFIGFFGWQVKKISKKLFGYYLYFAIWFLLGMGMLLQIFPLDMTVADRWMYFPIVGLLGMGGIRLMLLKNNKGFRYIMLIFIIVIIGLSIRTIIRNTNWVDAITLYSHDLLIDNNYDLQNYLGAELALQNRYSEALPHLLQGVSQFPHTTNLYNVGVVYEKLNDNKKALHYYLLAINHKESYGEEITHNAYVGLTRVFVAMNNSNDAIMYLKKALKRYPDDGSLWAYLAISEYRLDNQKEALHAAQKADSLLNNMSSHKLLTIIQNKKPLQLKAN